ncbi:MAG: dethiobiotin synthase, partial [Candidatus Omnitrophica bacterium]|nr:dethiobiotin synthase [Candidatus Omnitrophota bacterium]
MNRPLLVVGTDTGVGKTRVGTGLVKAMQSTGRPVLAIKPVESGISEMELHEEDGAQLAQASGQSFPTQALTRLKAPLAPPVAAEKEGLSLHPEEWVSLIKDLLADHAFTLVEGAGGLLSPLAWNWTARDLAEELQARVLLVASDRLGTLNHTLLTLEALDAKNLSVLGVVFSAPEVTDPSTGLNAD